MPVKSNPLDEDKNPLRSFGFETVNETKVIEFLSELNLDTLNFDNRKVAMDMLEGRSRYDTMSYFVRIKKYSKEQAERIYETIQVACDLKELASRKPGLEG